MTLLLVSIMLFTFTQVIKLTISERDYRYNLLALIITSLLIIFVLITVYGSRFAKSVTKIIDVIELQDEQQ